MLSIYPNYTIREEFNESARAVDSSGTLTSVLHFLPFDLNKYNLFLRN